MGVRIRVSRRIRNHGPGDLLDGYSRDITHNRDLYFAILPGMNVGRSVTTAASWRCLPGRGFLHINRDGCNAVAVNQVLEQC